MIPVLWLSPQPEKTMKRKTSFLLISLTALTLASAKAGPDPIAVSSPPSPGGGLYDGGELQVDLFGAYAFEGFEDGSFFGDDVFGGGLGVNYFFTRHFGIGVEGMLFDTDGDPFGSTAANAFLRLPISNSGLALYTFAGAGVVFNADKVSSSDFRDVRSRARDDDDSTGLEDALFEVHIGAGIEYRFSPRLGIFTDLRHTFVEDDADNYTSARAGIRIVF